MKTLKTCHKHGKNKRGTKKKENREKPSETCTRRQTMNEKAKFVPQFFLFFALALANIILLTICMCECACVDMTHASTSWQKQKPRQRQRQNSSSQCENMPNNPVGVTFVCINFNFDPLRITPSTVGPEQEPQPIADCRQTKKKKYIQYNNKI